MKRYNVKITDRALADMAEVYRYIAQELQSPATAMGQYDRIACAIERLDLFPEQMPRMASEPERSMGLRQLVIDNFSAFYWIEDDNVIVARVLYSASDISQRLME